MCFVSILRVSVTYFQCAVSVAVSQCCLLSKTKTGDSKKMHVEKGSEKNAGEMRDSVWQGIWRLEVVIHPVTQSSSLAQAVVCSCPLCGCLLSCSFAEDKRRPFNLLIYCVGNHGTMMLSHDNNVVFDTSSFQLIQEITFCFGQQVKTQ